MRRRMVRSFSKLFNQVCGAALRAAAATLVFTTGMVMVLRYLGVPMPSTHELLKPIEGLSSLAKIFS